MSRWIFALALLARLAVLPYTLPRYDWGRAYPDTGQYLAMAENLRAGHGLVVGPQARAERPPLYPLVLAAFQSLFGKGKGFALAVLLAQSALGALTAVLAADLGRRLFGARAGWVAGLAAALHPELLLYPSLLLTETMAGALVTAALWAAWRAPGSSRWALLTGALAGAAALTRASLLPMAALLAFWMARRPRPALLCLGAFAGALLPWILRNHRVLGAWVPVTTSMGRDLYDQCRPGATGGPVSGALGWPETLRGMNEVESDRALRRESLRLAREDPGRMLRLSAVRGLRFWNLVPNDPGHRTAAVMSVSVAANLPLFLLALMSLFRVLPGNPRAWILVATPVLLLGALHLVFSGSVRYRAPAIPALAVLAASTLPRREVLR